MQQTRALHPPRPYALSHAQRHPRRSHRLLDYPCRRVRNAGPKTRDRPGLRGKQRLRGPRYWFSPPESVLPPFFYLALGVCHTLMVIMLLLIMLIMLMMMMLNASPATSRIFQQRDTRRGRRGVLAPRGGRRLMGKPRKSPEARSNVPGVGKLARRTGQRTVLRGNLSFAAGKPPRRLQAEPEHAVHKLLVRLLLLALFGDVQRIRTRLGGHDLRFVCLDSRVRLLLKEEISFSNTCFFALAGRILRIRPI